MTPADGSSLPERFFGRTQIQINDGVGEIHLRMSYNNADARMLNIGSKTLMKKVREHAQHVIEDRQKKGVRLKHHIEEQWSEHDHPRLVTVRVQFKKAGRVRQFLDWLTG